MVAKVIKAVVLFSLFFFLYSSLILLMMSSQTFRFIYITLLYSLYFRLRYVSLQLKVSLFLR